MRTCSASFFEATLQIAFNFFRPKNTDPQYRANLKHIIRRKSLLGFCPIEMHSSVALGGVELQLAPHNICMERKGHAYKL